MVVSNKIECAAIMGFDGKVYSMPRPNRHHNIIAYMARDLGHPTPISGKQGFVTTDGEFVDRRKAKLIAIENNQLIPGHSQLDILFSECMW